MRKNLLLLVFTLFIVQLSVAQHAEECASGHIHHRLMQSDPDYANLMQKREQLIAQYQKNHQLNNKSGNILKIPIVVHVIHTGQAVGVGANISMAQINSAIDTLNGRYRNTHGPSVDTEIEFELAQRDPNGNATTGVVRVDGSSVTNYATEGISAGDGSGAVEADVKALSRWPNTQYYNVWVVTEIEDNNGLFGIQGYAYFPGASPSVDGTVIMHTAFGTTGTVNSFNNRNRTFVHELGHGLNLFHTFEGDNGGASCPTGNGDFVADTDPHIRASSNCPTGTNSCTGNSIDDETANFMNYSSQTCALRFTAGQSTRMRAAIDASRPSLTTSLGATAPAATSVRAAACTPSTTTPNNNFGIGIAQVKMSNVDVVSDNTRDEGDYVDQTRHQTIAVTAGTSYTIEVVTGSANNEDVEVYIDYNDDGDFLDAGENVFSSNMTSGSPVNSTHTGSIAIPASGIVTGTLLRMRVISDWFNNSITGSCYNPGFGQTEDYAIEISTAASPLSANIDSSANPSCFGGSDGIAVGSASGGTAPYSFVWSSGANTSTITGLSAGTYTLTVTDNAASTATTSVTITEPSAISATVTSTNESCALNDGTISVNASGGTPGYNYFWSTGASTANLTGLTQGTYTVTISDANACTHVASTQVGKDSCVSLAASVTRTAAISCNGFSDGAATASATGGTSPYTFLWNNGATTASISGLVASTYTVTVTDNAALTAVASLTITQPSALTATQTSTTNETCALNDGTISTNGFGGTPPYTFNWSNGVSSNNLSGLSQGTYTLTITDGNGCTYSDSVSVGRNNCGTPTASATVTSNVSCNGFSDGSALASATGGVMPYTYSWSNGAFTAAATGLAAGVYTVTVSDNAAATSTANVTITEPAPITATATSTTNESCALNDGTASTQGSGGHSPYTYNWTGGRTGSTINGLAAGTYTATITDANGCTVTSTATVMKDNCVNITGLRLFPADCGATNLDPNNRMLRYFTDPSATGYRVRINGGSLNNFVHDSGNDNNFNLNQISGIAFGTSYTVEIAAVVNGTVGSYGPVCNITTTSIASVNLMLRPGDCGATGLDPTNARLHYIPRSDASNYRVRLNGPGVSNVVLVSGNDNNFNLNEISGIQYSAIYTVEVAANINGQWSNYGTSCNVTTSGSASLVNITLRPGDCGATGLDPTSAQLHYITRSDASNYRVRVNGSGVSNFELVSGFDNNFRLNEITGIQYNATYSVEVAAFVNGSWSSYGTPCNISTGGTGTVINITLRPGDCGATGLDPSNAQLRYTPRSDVSNYRVRVNGNGVSNFELVSGNDNNFNLNEIPGVLFNETYTVEIAAFIGGSFNAYGTPCNITTLDPATELNLRLRGGDCGSTNLNRTAHRLHYNVHPSATNYRVRVNGPGVSNFELVSGNDNNFNLSEIPGLQTSQTYTVEIAAFINGSFSGYGNPCNITTAASPAPPFASIASNRLINRSDVGAAELSIYPNPATAERVYIRYENANHKEGDQVIVDVMDIQGKQVMRKFLGMQGQQTLTDLNGELSMKAGIYFIRLQDGETVLTEKLILR